MATSTKYRVGKVEGEILKATKTPKTAPADVQKHLNMILDRIQKLDDNSWNALSTAAQQWVNDATEAANAGKDLPEFPEGDADGDEAEDQEEETVTTKKAAAKKPAAKAPAKKAPAAPAKKPAAKAPAKAAAKKTTTTTKKTTEAPRGGVDVKTKVRKAILKNPDISIDDLVALVEKSGAEISKLTISTFRSEFRSALKFLINEGYKLGIEL